MLRAEGRRSRTRRVQVLDRCDSFLLAVAQRISDRIHEWTGLDSIHQARLLRVALSASWFFAYVDYHRRYGQVYWIAAIMVLSNLTTGAWEFDDDRQARVDAAAGLRNHRQLSSPGRKLWVVAAPLCIFLGLVAGTSVWAIFTCGYCEAYVGSCDVQAPRAGRIREALQSLQVRLSRRSCPAGV
jgi:hypothetical protein